MRDNSKNVFQFLCSTQFPAELVVPIIVLKGAIYHDCTPRNAGARHRFQTFTYSNALLAHHNQQTQSYITEKITNMLETTSRNWKNGNSTRSLQIL
jgi:hypothetical protein